VPLFRFFSRSFFAIADSSAELVSLQVAREKRRQFAHRLADALTVWDQPERLWPRDRQLLVLI
jgi:hypothetical protein